MKKYISSWSRAPFIFYYLFFINPLFISPLAYFFFTCYRFNKKNFNEGCGEV